MDRGEINEEYLEIRSQFLISANNSRDRSPDAGIRECVHYVKAADANLIISSLSPPFPLLSLSRASLSPDFSREKEEGDLGEERIIHSRSSYPRFSRGGARYFQSTFKFTIVHRGEGWRGEGEGAARRAKRIIRGTRTSYATH